MAFKVIETQEQFDAAIKERIDRVEAKYKDFDTYKAAADELAKLKAKDYDGEIQKLKSTLAEAQKKIADNDQIVSDLTTRAKTAETALLKNRVAAKHKIPAELAERLSGETEEDLEKDAESFAKFVNAGPVTAPLKTTESGGKHAATDAAYASLLSQLNNANT